MGVEFYLIAICFIIFAFVLPAIFYNQHTKNILRLTEEKERIQSYKNAAEMQVISLCKEIENLKQKIKALEKERTDLGKEVSSKEFQQLLADLMTGRGLVEVQRVDPNSIFVKSVKDI